jgi:hypothetical protein
MTDKLYCDVFQNDISLDSKIRIGKEVENELYYLKSEWIKCPDRKVPQDGFIVVSPEDLDIIRKGICGDLLEENKVLKQRLKDHTLFLELLKLGRKEKYKMFSFFNRK